MYYAGLTAALTFKVVFALSSVELFDPISWFHVGLLYHYLQQHKQDRQTEPTLVPAPLPQPQDSLIAGSLSAPNQVTNPPA